MSVTVTRLDTLTVDEIIETNDDSMSAANATVKHTEFNETSTLNDASTPPVTEAAHFVLTLAAGTATVDCRALNGVNGATVDGNGLKVQCLRVKNLGANTLAINGLAGNPYTLSGADWKATLSTGQVFNYYGNDAATDIGAAAKDIQCAGTLTQQSEWTIIMG